jgi:hypothetical protein
MKPQITFLAFEDWVAHVFDHDVSDPQWYFELDADFWDAPASLTLAYLTRLFNAPVELLARFNDQQLNQGFWYLVSNAGSNHMFALTDKSAPLAARLQCLRSFIPLFQQLFATRCTRHLSYIDQPGASPLNLACYMWWDIIPFFAAPNDESQRELDAAALDVMEETLAIDSVACKESALHGLGHWNARYPREVSDIIGRALRDARGWPPELERYARYAQSGCIL